MAFFAIQFLTFVNQCFAKIVSQSKALLSWFSVEKQFLKNKLQLWKKNVLFLYTLQKLFKFLKQLLFGWRSNTFPSRHVKIWNLMIHKWHWYFVIIISFTNIIVYFYLELWFSVNTPKIYCDFFLHFMKEWSLQLFVHFSH